MALRLYSPRGVELPVRIPEGYVIIRDCPAPLRHCSCCLMYASGFVEWGIPAITYYSWATGAGQGGLLLVREVDLPLVKTTPLYEQGAFNCLPPEEEAGA